MNAIAKIVKKARALLSGTGVDRNHPNYPEWDEGYQKRRRKREKRGEVPPLVRHIAPPGGQLGPAERALVKRAKRAAGMDRT